MKITRKRIYLTGVTIQPPSLAVGREYCSTTRDHVGSRTARRWFLEKKIDPTIVRLSLFWHHRGSAPLVLRSPVVWFLLTDDKKYVPGLFIHQACSLLQRFLNLCALNWEVGATRWGFGLMRRPLFQRAPHHIGESLGSWRPAGQEDWNMDKLAGNPRVPVAMMETART